jgi:hypothetical protein
MNKEFIDALATLYANAGEDTYIEDYFEDSNELFKSILGLYTNTALQEVIIEDAKKFNKVSATDVDDEFINAVKYIYSEGNHIGFTFDEMCNGITTEDIGLYILSGKKDSNFEQEVIDVKNEIKNDLKNQE